VSLVQVDLRVGGRFRIVFGGPHGNEHEVQGVYKAVVPPTFNTMGKLVFTWTWPNSTPERESVVTIEFRQVAAERAAFRTLDLLALCDALDQLAARMGAGKSVKSITPSSSIE